MTQTAPTPQATTTPAFEDIRYEIEGPTAIITINRPSATTRSAPAPSTS